MTRAISVFVVSSLIAHIRDSSVQRYKPSLIVFILILGFAFIIGDTRAEDIQFPPGAFVLATSPYGNFAMVNVKSAPYNAVGDGVTDDTAAIQSAINAVGFGIIYLPTGTYRITAPLVWSANGQDVPNRSLQGEGIDKTFIKLDNGATGFGNASSPQAVIQTRGEWWETNQAETATAFNNSLYSLTINTGSNNPGAVGLSWMVSNQGTLRSVAIVSGDGQGVAGVNYLGESGGLMEHVTITGFQYGIQGANGGYATLVVDGLNLSGQTVAGLRPDDDVFTVANLVSNNSVPALLTENSASRAVLVDSNLSGGSSSYSAVDYGGGNVFSRNITTAGYANALLNRGNTAGNLPTSGGITEWSSNAVNRLFPGYTVAQSLNLPRASYDPGFHTNDFSKWASVAAYYQSGDGSDWSPAFQRAIDSGAQIVYFPPSSSTYTLGETVHIRDNVREITGLRSATLGRLSGYSTPSMEFDDNNNAGASVVIEQMRVWTDMVINTKSPVVIRDMSTAAETGVVKNVAGVAANVTIDGMTGYAAFTSGTFATIRFLDPEYPPTGTACIYNNDSTVAMLGAKNEGVAVLCDNESGGSSELLGYYSSPFATPSSSNIALLNNNSSLYTFAFSRIGTPSYPTWVQETQNGTTLSGSQSSFTPPYAGYLPGFLNGGVAVANASFETPALGSGAISGQPSGSSWTYTGSSGIQSNGSPYGASNAPNGVQAAYLQTVNNNGASISQSINFSAIGMYTVSFQAARRTSYGGTQSFNVLMDGNVIGSYTPSSSSFTLMTTSAFNISVTGSHTLSFSATTTSGDNTDFLDSVAVNIYVPDNGFESPYVGTGSSAYIYNPTGSPWTFIGGAGIQANGSAWSANSAPDGTQTAFLQNNGSFYQNLTLPQGGPYTVSFQAARRPSGGAQTFTVSLDGSVIGTYSPTSTNFSAYTTNAFTLYDNGPHTLTFTGTTTSGDNSDFVDSITINNSAVTLPNSNFEAPALSSSSYQYNPTGGSWTFSGGGGVESNGSAWNAATAPDGTQTAFLQNSSSISQSITFASAGTYTAYFQSARRVSGGQQSFNMLVNGALVGTFSPTSTSFSLFSSSAFVVSAPGTYTISFVGTNASGDNTDFLDSLFIY